MEDIKPLPEFSAKQYVLLIALLVLATCGNALLSWLFPTLAGTAWATLMPPVLGLYLMMLLFRTLGVIKLPGIACYSALLAPLSAISFYQFVLQ